MRTTVTLEPDVAAKLRSLARERGISFKEALNTSVRQGLSGSERSASPLTVKPKSLGLRSGINLDKALQLAGELEDKETTYKLQLRK